MRRLGRLLVVAFVALTWVPASALASNGCTIVEDPAGDAGGVADLYGLSQQPVVGGSSSAVDLTRFEAGYAEDGALVVAWRVIDLVATTSGSDAYSVSWRAGNRWVWLNANRSAAGWSFVRDVSRGNGTSVNGAVSGEADNDGDAVRIRLPKSDPAYVRPGTRMNDVAASSVRSEQLGETFAYATWTDTTDLRDVRLRPDCAPPASATSLCTVLTDRAGDVGSRDASQDAHIDITSIDLGSTAETLTVRIGVRDLAASLPDGVDGQYWSVAWTSKGMSYGIRAERWRNALPAFTFSGPYSGDSATGVFDAGADAIVVDVDREAIGTPDRTPMVDVNAMSGNSSQADAMWSSQYDMASADAARYTPGMPCGVDVPVCPPVVDASGDAGPIFSSDGTDVPRNEPALDMRALGASSPEGVVRVSLSVDDADAELSPGWDTAGWTMSWTRNETSRYFVQAVRGPNGVRFTYGADPSNGAGYVSGPSFGGRRTTGSIKGDVVSVNVPRSAIGDPADGASLERFAASSWIMRGGTSAATYRVVDQTEQGWYVVGSDCRP